MKRYGSTYAGIGLLVALGAPGCDDPECPAGTVRLGTRCAPNVRADGGAGDGSEDDGDDGSVSIRDASASDATTAGVCGNGTVEPPESCDDGNAAAGDGCSERCEVEPDWACSPVGCVPQLATPAVQGAASMAPGRELWIWTTPDGTDHFELLLDDAPPADHAMTTETRFSVALSEGPHGLQVRACDAESRCSEWAAHNTVVESFGPTLPNGLRDAERTFTRTALGHPVAVGCNDCFDGTNGEVLGVADSAAALIRAAERGADLLEVNIASVGGQLHATRQDVAAAAGQPLLADLLANARLASADALLVLEIVEGIPAASTALAPDELARALMDAVMLAPTVARNGRPLWIRTSLANAAYLEAIRTRAANDAVVGPYIRFVVSDSGADIADVYASDGRLSSAPFADAVSVDFRAPSLLSRLERIRSVGAAAIVENVPGPGHGQIVLAALREQADAFLTNYRVDQARRIVTEGNAEAYFGPGDIAHAPGAVTMHGVRQGSPVSWEKSLGVPAQDGAPPTPTPGSGSNPDLFGNYLVFDVAAGELGGSTLPLYDAAVPTQTSTGILFSFYGVLRPQGVHASLSYVLLSPLASASTTQSASSVFSYQAGPEAGAMYGVQIPRGTTPRSGCTSKNGLFQEPLTFDKPHWIVGVLANATFSLFIDGKCVEEHADQRLTVPSPRNLSQDLTLGYLTSFKGHIQEAAVLRWEPPNMTFNPDAEN